MGLFGTGFVRLRLLDVGFSSGLHVSEDCTRRSAKYAGILLRHQGVSQFHLQGLGQLLLSCLPSPHSDWLLLVARLVDF